MRHRIFSYVFTFVVLTITIYILASSSELGILPVLFQITNLKFLGGAFICMLLYWLNDMLIFKTLFYSTNTRQSYLSSLKLTMVGQYYNLITPFGSGGQPAQILTMTNSLKLPLGLATSLTISKFMIYHVIITIFPLVMFLLKPDIIMRQTIIGKSIIAFGIGINVLGLFLIFALCFNSKIVYKIVLLFITLLKRFKLAKNIQNSDISRHINEYKLCLNSFLANKKILFIVSGFCLLQVTAYFSVTYFVYLSLGLSQASLLDILAIQSLLYTAVNTIPIPGNVGVSEGFFYLVFGIVFPAKLIVYAIMLWRLVIYYFNLTVTGLFVLFDHLFIRFRISRQGNPAK
ncbi:MAG: flippase-like domain-containing protein [Peptococcaceae bacterium]|nr:flippase-like domain-containing protein [Peptococcaceae bacterium]